MWWLALALWMICIIERGPLMNVDNQGWFNIFTVSKYMEISPSLHHIHCITSV